jgi:hypothetical protein
MSRPALASVTAGGLLLLTVVAMALVTLGGEARPPATGLAPDEIPAAYVPLYRAAATEYGVHWLLLGAIHDQETHFSKMRVSAISGDAVTSGWNGCGAAGPMQFGIVGLSPYHATAPDCGPLTGRGAGDTWSRYAAAGPRVRRRIESSSYPQDREDLAGCQAVRRDLGCVYDDLDAIAAAAAYLHDLGAGRRLDDRAWQATRRYNGTATYADAVLARARAWAAELADDIGAPEATTIAGARAILGSNGLARAPHDAPEAIKGAIAAANAISDRPYLEVHYPTHLDNPTYDCSSAVSHVLWGADAFGTTPWVSGQLASFGQPGPGRWITVYAHASHTFVVVAGLRFDTAVYDSGPNAGERGPRWRLGQRPTDGFSVRHPAGL